MLSENQQYKKALSWKNKILKSRLGFKKTWADIIAKYLTSLFGSVWFLNTSGAFIFVWIIINLGFIDGISPFDPYPFILLMTILQFFAIFLSIIVLINQNRQGRISEVRQHIDFEINVRAEHEITKILHMLEELHTELGIAKIDTELEQMKEKIDIAEIKEEVESALEREKRI